MVEKKLSLEKNFQKKILTNGMTILFEKRDVPVVSVVFAVRAGGNNEELSEKGISHYIEHMLYKGTPTRNSKKIAEEIERLGGDLNGFTSEEIVAYWCKMPSKNLNVALDVLADMVKNPLFDEKEMEKERKVIFEELKMRHDTPRICVLDEVQQLLYTGTVGMDLIGTYETMNSINRKKILENFKKIYTPNNLILCVVGDAKFEDLVKFAEKNFGNEKSLIPKQKFDLKNEKKVELRKGIDQANLVFAYHIPVAGDKKSYGARILSCLMAEGMSSRLFAEIREKRNLAYSIKGESNIARDFAYNYIYVGTSKENAEQVKKLILEEFEKVAKNLKEDELKIIKEQLIGNYDISMEDSQMQMVNLIASEIQGDAKEFYEFEKNISKVKLEDVKEIAKKVVDGDYSVFELLPEN